MWSNLLLAKQAIRILYLPIRLWPFSSQEQLMNVITLSYPGLTIHADSAWQNTKYMLSRGFMQVCVLLLRVRVRDREGFCWTIVQLRVMCIIVYPDTRQCSQTKVKLTYLTDLLIRYQERLRLQICKKKMCFVNVLHIWQGIGWHWYTIQFARIPIHHTVCEI